MDRNGPEKKRGRLGLNPDRHQKQSVPSILLPDSEQYGNRDLWLERRLAFLHHESTRLNAGVIARHYQRCALAAYSEFKASQTAAVALCVA
jgi:hypothetical protein